LYTACGATKDSKEISANQPFLNGIALRIFHAANGILPRTATNKHEWKQNKSDGYPVLASYRTVNPIFSATY
jgi:hypothetical protein